jgi:hypothetical protein
MVAVPKLKDPPRQTASDAVLDQLSAQFNERLANLQAPNAGKKAAAVFKRKGKLSTRPKAGTAF